MTPSVSQQHNTAVLGALKITFFLKMLFRKVMQQQIANLSAPLPCRPLHPCHTQCCPQGPGAHPVILRANSPATPGTIQDTLPPALPVQRIPNPHVCNASSTLFFVQNQRVEYTLPLRKCDKCYIHVVWVCFTLVLFALLPTTYSLQPSSAQLTSSGLAGLLWQRVWSKRSTYASTWQYVQRSSWRFRCEATHCKWSTGRAAHE